LGIVALCESGEVEPISSEALFFETERNPNVTRREYAGEVLSKAKQFVSVSDQVEKRARELNALTFQPLDALHLASAEEARADYFCTCDDKLLRKAKAVSGLKVKVISPVDLVEEVERW
jgi:predicted nucleic acid-binding protein